MTSTTVAAPETTETAELSFTVNIDDGPITPDYDGASRGWRACLILDPEDRTVREYTCIGSGTPEYVWHNRAWTVSVNVAASGEHLTSIVEEQAELIEAIFDRYEGSHWDGNNTVGSWDEGEHGELEDLVQQLKDALEKAPNYWSAGDWLGGAWSECRGEVAKALEAKRDLDELAAEWVTQGAANDALLDQADVRKNIGRMIEELREEGDDE